MWKSTPSTRSSEEVWLFPVCFRVLRCSVLFHEFLYERLHMCFPGCTDIMHYENSTKPAIPF